MNFIDDYIQRYVTALKSVCPRCVQRHKGMCEDLHLVAKGLTFEESYALSEKLIREGKDAHRTSKLVNDELVCEVWCA
jgi:hypothetical protein